MTNRMYTRGFETTLPPYQWTPPRPALLEIDRRVADVRLRDIDIAREADRKLLRLLGRRIADRGGAIHARAVTTYGSTMTRSRAHIGC